MNTRYVMCMYYLFGINFLTVVQKGGDYLITSAKSSSLRPQFTLRSQQLSISLLISCLNLDYKVIFICLVQFGLFISTEKQRVEF